MPRAPNSNRRRDNDPAVAAAQIDDQIILVHAGKLKHRLDRVLWRWNVGNVEGARIGWLFLRHCGPGDADHQARQERGGAAAGFWIA